MAFEQSGLASLRRAVRTLRRLLTTDAPRRDRVGGPGPAAYPPGTRPEPDETRFDYDPRDDERGDPGEVVWAWVAYEDDPRRGKDRPVLVIGRDGNDLLGLYLSSQDHDRDAADEAAHGRYWMDLGTGAWDPRGRPSEVRLDRVVRLRPSAVRRIGARLDRLRFDEVVAAARRY